MILEPAAERPHHVRVWHVSSDHVASDRARLARRLAWLDDEERARHARFRVDADRDLFLTGRLLARAALSSVTSLSPTSWRFREGTHGRPEIDAPGTTWRFNLAHSGGLVACVVADGRDAGVDVEDLRRPEASEALMRRCLASSELADVQALPAAHRARRFLEYWTLKEAYLKARGLGVSVPLADVSFRLEDEADPTLQLSGALAAADAAWTMRLSQPTGHHLLAVAASAAGDPPSIAIAPADPRWLDPESWPPAP